MFGQKTVLFLDEIHRFNKVVFIVLCGVFDCEALRFKSICFSWN